MKFLNIRNAAIGFLAMFAAVTLMHAERPQEPQRGQPQQQQPKRPPAAPQASRPAPRPMPAQIRTGSVDRTNHGSIRHIDNHMIRPPSAGSQLIRVNQANHPAEPRRNAIRYHDVEVDTHHSHFWHGFVFGARFHSLNTGYLQIIVNGAPYYYYDGIYYQQVQADNSYQEVYPPLGAQVESLPDGAVEIDAADTTYYYAGGAFYVQNDNGFAIAAVPIGVVVPEPPPGVV